MRTRPDLRRNDTVPSQLAMSADALPLGRAGRALRCHVPPTSTFRPCLESDGSLQALAARYGFSKAVGSPDS